GGCGSEKPLLDERLDTGKIDEIKIVLAMGNPEYGAESKIITDKEEIQELTEIFSDAVLGDKVDDGDVAVCDTSNYCFYSQGNLINKIIFNGNDTLRAFKDGKIYYVSYGENIAPYEAYKKSDADVEIVYE
ncbi:MAG: hypothetical protein RSC41_06465, partial [Oscillospiraceae bacterium]